MNLFYLQGDEKHSVRMCSVAWIFDALLLILQNPGICSSFQHCHSQRMTRPRDVDTVSIGLQRQFLSSKFGGSSVLLGRAGDLSLNLCKCTKETFIYSCTIYFACIIPFLSLKGKDNAPLSGLIRTVLDLALFLDMSKKNLKI